MPASFAQDAIALLIEMAERGEIDPWDVKVIEVIDRFLSELNPLALNSLEPYDRSLSRSGQAFLYASMLVLLKADSLTQAEAEEPEDLDRGDLLELGDVDGSPLPPNLEKRLSRRAASPPLQRRRVTLQDLIDQLQAIAESLESPTPRKALIRPRPQPRNQAIRAIAQLAHQENLSEMAVALEQFFATHWPDMTAEEWLDFNHLLTVWAKNDGPKFLHHPHKFPDQRDPVGVFWALLLLSSQSKVELSQDEFYQDLRVRPISAIAESDAVG